MRTSTLSRTEPDRAELERVVQRLEAGGDRQAVIRLVEAWDHEGTVTLAAGLAQARAFLDLRLMDRAWVRLRELGQAWPEDPEILVLTARVFIERGWPARARKLVEQLRELQRRDGRPDHPALEDLDRGVNAPPLEPPADARQIEREGDPAALLALAERYLATGSFLRARSILERIRRVSPHSDRVELLLWGLQGEYLPRGRTLAELLAELPGAGEWESAENTENVRRAELGGADPPTAEVSRGQLVDVGLLEGGARFPSLFRRVERPGDAAEEEDVTAASGIASPEELRSSAGEDWTDPGRAPPEGPGGQEGGGDTQIMQVIRGPGGGRLAEVDGPIHHPVDERPPGQLRETLDLRAWQQSMGMPGAGVEEQIEEDDGFLEAEDDELVIMTRRQDAPPAPPSAAPRQGPIEVVEKRPVPEAHRPPPPVSPAPPAALAAAPAVEAVGEGGPRRLLLAIVAMIAVMGGATLLSLRYLHGVVATDQREAIEVSLAQGDYRGLQEQEARLQAEVAAGVEPVEARALSLAIVEAVLWSEYTGSSEQRDLARASLERARAGGAAEAELAIAEGMLALGEWDLDRAAAASARAGDDGALAAELAARVALARGEPGAGLERWEAAASAEPEGLRVQVLREALMRAAGDAAGADALAAELLAESADQPLVGVASVAGAWAGGTDLERIQAIDALVQGKKDVLSPRQVGTLLLHKGELLFRSGRRQEAIDAWRRAVSVDRSHPDPLLRLTTAALWDGRVVDASKEAQACLQANPAHAGCRRAVVQVLLELDRINEARQVVTAWADSAAPGPASQATVLGAWAEIQDGRADGVTTDLLARVEALGDGADGLTLYLLGLALAAQPDGQRNAERLLERAVTRLEASSDPLDTLLVQRAQAAALLVVEADQLEALARALLPSVEGDAMAHVWVAQRYEALGRKGSAAHQLEMATRQGPETALAWHALGQFYFAPATMGQAKAAWRKYLALEPSGARAERARLRLR